MRYQELNLDGLVSPCHNYAGLSPGNLASEDHRGQDASPKQAALQGLDKMWRLHQLGIPQAVMPPQLRPRLDMLRTLGFSGNNTQLIDTAARQAPELLAACYSASSMWAANSATVTCSADSNDHKLHFTPANLLFNLHRSLEAKESSRILKRIFGNSEFFVHHPPLPASIEFGDEGAANHTRLCSDHNQPGLTLLTYGYQQQPDSLKPNLFPARHSLQATETIIRAHQLGPQNSLSMQQLPASIDRGVFHNDVIAVGHRNLLLLHEEAWLNQAHTLEQIQRCWERLTPDNTPLYIEQVSRRDLNVEDTVTSYLFNSQLLTLSSGEMLLLAPLECQEQDAARAVIEKLLVSYNPLTQVEFMDLRQSMNNGGGPACLRLRVPLSDTELAAMHQGVLLTPALYQALQLWINQYYRDQLGPDDLRDPALIDEIHNALSVLEQILDLPGLYNFV
ncbi:MAG: N-succinylarginine dihydrolase [Oceanospirillaceae bacterium]|nr:N-succinylarginine dihydrolase [Oceanospirillaceae bacterium]